MYQNFLTAKWVLLSTEINDCYPIYGRGGHPGGVQCTARTNNPITVNIEKPFLLPQVYNISKPFGKLVSTSYLKGTDGNAIIDPMSFVLHKHYLLSPNDSINVAQDLSAPYHLPLDNFFLRSDISSMMLSAGVYLFDKYIPSNDIDEFKIVDQYLFYFEKTN